MPLDEHYGLFGHPLTGLPSTYMFPTRTFVLAGIEVCVMPCEEDVERVHVDISVDADHTWRFTITPEVAGGISDARDVKVNVSPDVCADINAAMYMSDTNTVLLPWITMTCGRGLGRFEHCCWIS